MHNTKAYADSENGSKQTYLIYDLDGALISETNFVEIGDIIIDKNLNEYEIIYVDNYLQIAQCKYTGTYNKPKIKNLKPELYLSNNSIKKSIGLYMTHNDESYVPSDGYSSIYGKGGIHDVATQLSNNFKDLGYTVYLNENLHLPHDSDAYSRSLSTAKDLLNKNPDALFDIHRDGVARNVYVKTVDGVERCKVRIVVGQKNPNKDANLQFAMYLVTVAEEYCPWLFLDIYYAKGNYNQELTSKGLLFEMGTYLAEKELVLNTTKNLAEVVDKTLFSTVIEEDNSLTITDKIENEKNLINNVLNNKNTIIHHNKHITNVVVFTFVGVVLLCFVAFFAHRRKIKHEKQNKIKKEK
ncbi:MAG: stage II sporulation protein P [Clostridia bacterium]|nr:stage II sporulation protein P [Clostridia bacterium]